MGYPLLQILLLSDGIAWLIRTKPVFWNTICSVELHLKNLSATGGKSSPRNIEFFVDMNGNKDQRIFHECTNQFTSIPKESFLTKFNKGEGSRIEQYVLVYGISSTLKIFCWLGGPYSKLGEPLAPLPSSTFAPETKAITSRGVEIRWHPLKDQRYGRTIRYTLNGKKAGQNSFSTIFIGKGLNCVVQAIGNKALKPNTTYVFELQIKTADGDVHSQLLPVTTLAAPPDPPPKPTVGMVTSGSVELSWSKTMR